jgi:hypothetical protein
MSVQTVPDTETPQSPEEIQAFMDNNVTSYLAEVREFIALERAKEGQETLIDALLARASEAILQPQLYTSPFTTATILLGNLIANGNKLQQAVIMDAIDKNREKLGNLTNGDIYILIGAVHQMRTDLVIMNRNELVANAMGSLTGDADATTGPQEEQQEVPQS